MNNRNVSIVENMTEQKKILITGFETFANHSHNPTERLILDLEALKMSQVETLLLPVSYKRAFQILKVKIEELKPKYVIATGLAGDRDLISLERVAINCESAHIADNDGDIALERPIKERGQAAFFTTLPIMDFQKCLNEKGFKSQISNSAGTYVCNSLMYQLLDYAVSLNEKMTSSDFIIKAGFVHYPPTQINSENSKWTSESLLKATLEILSQCH